VKKKLIREKRNNQKPYNGEGPFSKYVINTENAYASELMNE